MINVEALYTNTTYLKAIGDNIRFYRKIQNILQKNLAKDVSITQAYLSHIENGHRNFSVLILHKIALILEIQSDTLLDFSTDHTLIKEYIMEHGK